MFQTRLARVAAVALIAAGALGTTACVRAKAGVGVARFHSGGPGIGHGPPPHAPAHGYRHQQAGGLVLEYDTGLGAYVALGKPDTYYHHGKFLRRRGAGWDWSSRIDGPWMSARDSDIPPGLKKSASSSAGGGLTPSGSAPPGAAKSPPGLGAAPPGRAVRK